MGTATRTEYLDGTSRLEATASRSADRVVSPTGTAELPSPHSTKRVLDLWIAVGLSIVAVPPALLIAILVKVTSRGPLFFHQKRVGHRGATFEIKKFRTMHEGTDQEVMLCELQRARYEANGFKMDADDPRITAFGRFLRKTSLDELPQLLNVLRGEMSLVGIRPLLPDELARRSWYDQQCYESLRPGMTGLWQVSGRSAVTLQERIELDRCYVESWSLRGDLKILFRTPGAVIRVHHAK